jgi:hypothetical protein
MNVLRLLAHGELFSHHNKLSSAQVIAKLAHRPQPYLSEREPLADAQLHSHPCENSLIAKPAAWVAFGALRSRNKFTR